MISNHMCRTRCYLSYKCKRHKNAKIFTPQKWQRWEPFKEPGYDKEECSGWWPMVDIDSPIITQGG